MRPSPRTHRSVFKLVDFLVVLPLVSITIGGEGGAMRLVWLLSINRAIQHTGIRRGRRLVTQWRGISDWIGWVLGAIEPIQLRRLCSLNLRIASDPWNALCRHRGWWENGALGKEMCPVDRGESKAAAGKLRNGDGRS